MAGNNDDDVMGFHGNPGNIQKLPKGLEKFKNLKVIYPSNGQIRELSSDDLKPFPEILELYFDNNKIEVLEEGVFNFCSKLAAISFTNNRLFHISANVFDHLTDLRNLWLNGNSCPNGIARNDRNAVLNLIVTAKSTCQSQIYLRMEMKLKGLTDNCKNLDSKTKPGNNQETSSNEELNTDNLTELKVNEKKLEEFKVAVLKKFDDFEADYKNMHSELMNTFEQKFMNLEKCFSSCN